MTVLVWIEMGGGVGVDGKVGGFAVILKLDTCLNVGVGVEAMEVLLVMVMI
jgi:hypothetical protein